LNRKFASADIPALKIVRTNFDFFWRFYSRVEEPLWNRRTAAW